MATLTVCRAEPFTRGDCSIHILLDGKPAGNLRTDTPLVLHVPAGTHTLQATMQGLGLRGSLQKIRLSEDEVANFHLSGTKLPDANSWWDMILFLLVCVMPGDLLSGYFFWLGMAVYAFLLGVVVYRRRKWRPHVLKLEPSRQRVVHEVMPALRTG